MTEYPIGTGEWAYLIGDLRFMEYPFCHMPLGKEKTYAEEVRKVSFEKLARLIKVLGFLMQTKVYLFWARTKSSSNISENRAIRWAT